MIEASASGVSGGTRLVEHAADRLGAILNSAHKSSSLVEAIAKSSALDGIVAVFKFSEADGTGEGYESRPRPRFATRGNTATTQD